MNIIFWKAAKPITRPVNRYMAVFAAFMLAVLLACNGSDSGADKTPKDSATETTDTPVADTKAPLFDTSIVTVATLIKMPDTVKVLFDQRQAFYFLFKKDKDFATKLQYLETKLRTRESFRVITDNKNNNILGFLPLSAAALDSLSKAALNNVKSLMQRKLAQFDSALINRVTGSATAAVACTDVIPDLATATNIFNFCAAQSCNIVSPPPTVVPCITFQYVRDGCYARAHKMAWIIQRYNYCVQKVFSFANNNVDQLAVTATKWGGCCVTWWYHVAPLVKVRISGTVYYYVFDPGMFNAPVPLATWLAAQADTRCSPRARVTMYSFADASAYQPANYQGTLFNTDPNLVATDQTLRNYRYSVTCP